MRHFQRKASVLGMLFVVGFVLMTVAPAVATPGPQTNDNLHINCISPTCTSGTSLVSTSSDGTFGLTNTGQAFTGTAFVVLLTPDSGASVGTVNDLIGAKTTIFTGSFTTGNLGTLLGFPLNDYVFGNLSSASSVGGTTPGNFFVREWTFAPTYVGAGGGGSSNFASCCQYTGLKNGSVIVAFVVDAGGNIIQTPLSSSLAINTPEPASLLLLGAGLAGIGIWRRRKELTA